MAELQRKKQKSVGTVCKDAIMTGISYMIPVIVGGGVITAIAKMMGGYNIGDTAAEMQTLAQVIFTIGNNLFAFAVPCLAAFIAYAIADKPGIAPGYAMGVLAGLMKTGFVAALFVNGLNADGFFIPTSAKMCAGMTSPLGIAISTVLPWSRNKFTKTEKEQALSLVILSCCYVQEGVIPFQLKDPVRLTASICVGGAITGGLCMMFGLESPAVHGGVFSVAMTSNPLLFIGLWLLGGCITGLLYSILKRPLAEGAEDEEMENPLI